MRHLNLLPKLRQLALKREMMLISAAQFLASVLVGLVILTVVALISSGVMWALSLVNVQSAEAELAVQIAEYDIVRREIAIDNALLKSINKVEDDRLAWSSLLGELLTLMPLGGVIETLRVDASDSTISLAGTAATRTSLVAFEDRLEALSWLAALNAPRENLLRRLNPTYTFTLTVDLGVMGISEQRDGEE